MVKAEFSSLKCRLDILFENYIQDEAFTGAVLGFSFIKNTYLERKIFCFGSVDGSKRCVDKQTFFDLASLTKPLVTVLSLLSLIQEKKIFWDSKLESLLSRYIPKDKKNITLYHLMSHTSGLPAHKPYFEQIGKMPMEARKEEMVKCILEEKLLNLPGLSSIYSDLGYILLGRIIEEKSGKALNEYWREKIAAPLSLHKKLIFPKKNNEKRLTFAFTNSSSRDGENFSVEVNDDNCRILGGVAGHAGLYGTIEGVLPLCENILLQWYGDSIHPSYSQKLLKKSLTREKKMRWTPGFDTPSAVGSSSGNFFSSESVGHLGFTGTSFWIDLKKKIVIVLLTNRVFFGSENEKLKKIRPFVHDLVMQEILK